MTQTPMSAAEAKTLRETSDDLNTISTRNSEPSGGWILIALVLALSGAWLIFGWAFSDAPRWRLAAGTLCLVFGDALRGAEHADRRAFRVKCALLELQRKA